MSPAAAGIPHSDEVKVPLGVAHLSGICFFGRLHQISVCVGLSSCLSDGGYELMRSDTLT